MVPRVPPGGELRGRHSYAFDTTRLGSQSLLKRLAQHRAPPGGPRPPFLLVLTLILFSPALKNCLSVFSVCLVSYRESAIFPSHPPTSGKIEVWETTTLPSLPR